MPVSLAALVVLAVCSVLGVPVAAQQVWVVDATGSGDFTSLQDAVVAAASGDTLLVRSTTSDVFGVETFGKSLDIVGDGQDIGQIPSLIVSGLPADGVVRLKNLALGASNFGGAALLCNANAGLVWVEACTLVGGDGAGDFIQIDGGEGARLFDSDAVIFARCTFQGGVGLPACGSSFCDGTARPGGAGARVEESDVSFYECTLTGGPGGPDANAFGGLVAGAGGHGLVSQASTTLLVDCVVQGGPGGDTCSSDPSACVGGNGLELAGPDNLLRRRLSSFQGGAGGDLGGGRTAAAGVPQVVDPESEVEFLQNAPRRLTVGSPLREDQVGLLRFEGGPGDVVGLFWSPLPGYLYLPGRRSTLALGSPLLGPLFVVTVTDPGGVLEIPFPVPDITPFGLDAYAVHGQCFHASGGQVFLSSPTAFTVLATGF